MSLGMVCSTRDASYVQFWLLMPSETKEVFVVPRWFVVGAIHRTCRI